MDAINPWLDAADVRRLAEQLLRPVAPRSLPSGDPGFGSSFVGFTSTDPADSSVEEIGWDTDSPIKPRAEAKIQDSSDEDPQPPPTAPSPSRLLERIQILRDWLAKNLLAADTFILDREGKVIFDESGHGRLHFMARNLALTSRGSGHIHVKIGPSSILELIPCETACGYMILGTLVPESLPSDQVHMITEALIQTASPA